MNLNNYETQKIKLGGGFKPMIFCNMTASRNICFKKVASPMINCNFADPKEF